MRILRGAAVLLAASGLLVGAAGASAQQPCGGLLQPRCPPPPPPPPLPPPGPVAATLALTPGSATRRIDDDKDLTLRGTVGGVAEPQGLFVELRRRVPGYGPGGLMAPLLERVKADGTFEFKLVPRISLDVQAWLREDGRATGHSPVRRITVRSRQHLSLGAVSAKRGRFVLTSIGPRRVALVSGTIGARAGKAGRGYLYLVAKHGRSALRIGSGRARNRGCDGAFCRRSAIGYFRITPTIVHDRRDFIACARASLYVAVQDPAVSPDCGKARITLARARAT